jgi:hypothetical protein
MKKTFTAKLFQDGAMCAIPVLFDPREEFGRARAPVVVTLNGYTYRSTIAIMGGGAWVPLRKSNREAAGLAGDETLKVTLELDVEKREVTTPKELAKALKAAGAPAVMAWRALSYSHQREHVEAIEGAVKPETRAKRVTAAVQLVMAKATTKAPVKAKVKPKAVKPSKTAGTKDAPWKLTTPPGTSAFEAYREDDALVVQVGSTQLRYQLRCIDDLHAMLRAHGDWMALGGADEQKPAADGTVEAWGRAAGNPVGGWYGLKKGLRGRFGVYVPPVLEALGLVELEHNAKNNRVRAK